jgi:hypothetical protein
MGLTSGHPAPESRYHDLEGKSLQELRALTKDPVFYMNPAQRDLILALIQERLLAEAAKPHWTTVPVFWATIIGTVAACIAAYPVLRDWFK